MSQTETKKSCGGCPCGHGKTEEPRWKEDFPIDWDADHYVTRRELTKFLALGSALLAGASSMLAAIGLSRKPKHHPEQFVTQASAIPAGGHLLFTYPTKEDACILVRDASGKLQAYSQVCTHLSCAVVHRPRENTLLCPCHHGYFSVEEGRPTAGPPTRPLPRIVLAERGDAVYAVGIEA